MKFLFKLLMIAAVFFTIHLAFAASPAMNLLFVDHLSRSGSVLAGKSDVGPTIERNGGTTQWTYTSDSTWVLTGLVFASGVGFYCFSDGGNLVLNTERYQGDQITISYDSFTNGHLQCSCSGSACDVSLTQLHR